MEIIDELKKINSVMESIATGTCMNTSGTDIFAVIEANSEVSKQTSQQNGDADLNLLVQNIQKNISSLYSKIRELHSYSLALGKGNLDVDLPQRRNYLAGGLKELHTNLLHMTWKVNQIARGDYNQKVDFMGKFSVSFNEMVAKLKSREAQLAETWNVVDVMFQHSNIIVFVVDIETGDLVYGKGQDYHIYYDSSFLDLSNNITNKIKQKSLSATKRMFDWEMYCEPENKWYTVKSMALTWTNNREVIFHMLFDISDQKVIQERLEKAVSTDAKTGAYSDVYAKEEVQSLIDCCQNFSICYFDLDGLKAINDNMGHVFGDELLKAFIKIVRSSIRPRDSICRLGGDEFLLITPSTNEADTEKIIARIKEKAENANKSNEFGFNVAFSYGIEYFDGNMDISAKALMDNADKKMYTQKKQKKLKAVPIDG